MYRRTPISPMLTFRRRPRPTDAMPAGGADTLEVKRHSRAHFPKVGEVTPAEEGAITLTLEGGGQVTVTAVEGTCMHRDGLLVVDYHNPDSPAYLIPSPHLAWEVRAQLGLWRHGADHRELNRYLLVLTSITEVDWTDGVLSLTHVGRTGTRYFAQFSGEVSVNFTWDVTSGNFTRTPLTVFVQERRGDDMKLVGFRIDHTPGGYAALVALGWDAPLPDLEERR